VSGYLGSSGAVVVVVDAAVEVVDSPEDPDPPQAEPTSAAARRDAATADRRDLVLDVVRDIVMDMVTILR
jgi:hypothetical protein